PWGRSLALPGRGAGRRRHLGQNLNKRQLNAPLWFFNFGLPTAWRVGRCGDWLRRTQCTARIALSEVFKMPFGNRQADIRHKPLIETNIMHRQQDRAKHLPRQEEVPNRPAAETAAGVTIAASLNRAI